MSIKLDYILRRNKSNLKALVAAVKSTLEPENETKVSRKVSKTPKPRKRRHSSKKQQPAPKLSDSSDKR